MKSRKLKNLIAVSLVAMSLVACSGTKAKEDVKDTVDKGKTMVEEGTDKVKNMADDTREKIDEYVDTDKTKEYNAGDLKKDLEAKEGMDNVTLYKTKDSMFSTPKYDIDVMDETIHVYDYNKITDLDKDLEKVTDKGLKIDNKDANWKTTPHYYKKGEILVIYDGENDTILSALNEILGKELY